MPTTRPKSGMNRPSTPASFMRRSAISGALRDVRISRKRRFASLSSRKRASMRFKDCVTSRVASGWIGRFDRSAIQNSRMRFTGSRSNTSSRMTLTRSLSTLKSLASAIARVRRRKRPTRRPNAGVALGVPLLERRADDRGQIADVLGDEEIVLHEPLDVDQPGAGRIAELTGDRALNVEAQPLLRPAGEKVEPAAHAPEEFLAAAKQRELARREQTGGDQLAAGWRTR